MSSETTEFESDAEWLRLHAGTEPTEDQVEKFCERVSVKWADGKTNEEARLEAFEGR